MKEGPGGEAGAFKETSQSRDQGALDAPILSQNTNQARRGSRKRSDPPVHATGRGLSLAPFSRLALMTKRLSCYCATLSTMNERACVVLPRIALTSFMYGELLKACTWDHARFW